MNRRGHREEPWGISQVTSLILDFLTFMEQYCAVMQVRFEPVPSDPSNAIRHQFLDHDSVISCIECFVRSKKSRQIQFFVVCAFIPGVFATDRDVTVVYSFWNAE